MSATAHTDVWRLRDLPVLRALDRLTSDHDGPVDVRSLALAARLPSSEVLDALDALELLRAVAVDHVLGQEPRATHVTAIGSAMLAMQAEDDEAHLVGRCAHDPERAREGCTLGGSPGIFG